MAAMLKFLISVLLLKMCGCTIVSRSHVTSATNSRLGTSVVKMSTLEWPRGLGFLVAFSESTQTHAGGRLARNIGTYLLNNRHLHLKQRLIPDSVILYKSYEIQQTKELHFCYILFCFCRKLSGLCFEMCHCTS